jgi:putative peptidoglycan lipid II flippase
MTPSNQAIIELTVWMLPSLVFLSLYGLTTAFLQCQKVFFLSSLAPIAFNGVWIAALIAMGYANHLSLKLLSVAIVLGFAAQLLFLLPKLIQAFKGRLTFKELLTPSLFDGRLRQLVKPFCLTAIGVSTTQINAALDSLFAKAQDPSGPAYLWYAIRIEQVPLALFAISASTALLPLMTKYLKQNLQDKAKESLQHSLCKVVALLLLSTGGLACCGVFGLNVLFGRGEFYLDSLHETYFCLLAYVAGLVFQGVSLVFISASYALEEFKKPMTISLASIGLHLGCNVLFVQGFHLGPISVALSTSIAACFQMLWLLSHIRSYKQITLDKLPWLRYFLISFFSAIAGLCSNYGLMHKLFIEQKLLSFMQALQGCLIGGFVYLSIFFLLEKLLNLSEVSDFFRRQLK